MTDETDTYLDTLRQTQAKLLNDLKCLNEPPPSGEEAEPLDRSPRNISATLKAIEDVRVRIERAEEKQIAKTYTRWEDLPPPTPEDEARFYEEFKRLFRRIADR